MTVDLRLGELSEHNRELTQQLVTTLVANAGQAMALGQVDPRPVSVSARVEEDWIHLDVLDPLPPIAPAKWCAEGSTMAFMRGRLHERDGDMTQHAVPGGKEIRCVWRGRMLSGSRSRLWRPLRPRCAVPRGCSREVRHNSKKPSLKATGAG